MRLLAGPACSTSACAPSVSSRRFHDPRRGGTKVLAKARTYHLRPIRTLLSIKYDDAFFFYPLFRNPSQLLIFYSFSHFYHISISIFSFNFPIHHHISIFHFPPNFHLSPLFSIFTLLPYFRQFSNFLAHLLLPCQVGAGDDQEMLHDGEENTEAIVLHDRRAYR